MGTSSDRQQPDFIREKLIGLGEHSMRKNYFSELQKRLEELETFRNLLDKIHDGILMLRLPAGEIVDVNEAGCSILGRARETLLGAELADLFPAAAAQLSETTVQEGSGGRRQSFHAEFERADGSKASVEVAVDVAVLGIRRFAVVILRDVSERRRADAMLHHVSTHDALTGLYNRTYLEFEFRHRSSSMRLPCALIACDIDGLKMTNETLGHHAGDQLLVMTATLLNELSDPCDIVSRVGGDEFVLVRPGAGREAAETFCRNLREAVESLNQENRDSFLSLSVGYAVAERQPVEFEDLLRDADNLVRREKLLRSQSTRSSIVSTVMTLLEARDFITEGHAERLEELVSGMAETLGLTPSRVDAMKLFAKFHDIGKVGISDTILFKPGRLTETEREEMRRHSEIGYRIALSSEDLLHIAEWILRHHEWWDGSGYPIGLAGEAIPLECRILSIADAYDAMTSDRPYRSAMPAAEAMRELERYSGIQFDPELLDPFRDLLRRLGALAC